MSSFFHVSASRLKINQFVINTHLLNGFHSSFKQKNVCKCITAEKFRFFSQQCFGDNFPRSQFQLDTKLRRNSTPNTTSLNKLYSCSFLSVFGQNNSMKSLQTNNLRYFSLNVTEPETVSKNKSDLDNDENVDKSKTDDSEEFHSIITNTERGKGEKNSFEFQAETRKLLDIVAKSLYSEKEVFIRELISNSSDALEKLRYFQLTGTSIADANNPLEIHIACDSEKKTFTIQDTGLGLTKNEMVENLGTIAKSGSKAFLEQVNKVEGSSVNKNIIGQFGVGFYSSFMVGETVDVYSKSYKPDSPAHKWTSNGLGSYEISEAEGVERGTKIVIHLKGDAYDFSKEETVKEIINKYSNFVGVPIYLNGKKVNIIEALWTLDARSVTDEMHEEFYKYISKAFDRPRYSLLYKADAPLNIRSLFYVPEYKPSMFEMSRETDVSVVLYSRKILIMSKANHILPKWMRFMKGVVDSEDIPLNLSRELLQDSALIKKLSWVLTNRIIKFFHEQSKKDPEKFLEFYRDYGLFLREGVVTTPDQDQREEIARLLRFESSTQEPGVKVNLGDYISRMEAGSRNIYYLSAPNRQLAEASPYMEAIRKQNVEVLYCYEPYDELVLMNLGQFDKKTLKSVENTAIEKDDQTKIDETNKDSITQSEADDLIGWLQVTLTNKIQKAKITHKLETHPCVISVPEMGAARHFLKTSLADKSEEERFRILQPTLEFNPSHPLIRKLCDLKTSKPDLAKLLAEQIFDNAMIAADLVEDPRTMLSRLNELLTKALNNN